ncbi:MAG: hypothetical protein ACERKZ_18585 [Lachnotalea sp.]
MEVDCVICDFNEVECEDGNNATGKMPKIFEPIRIKNIEFQNRIVMAPMVPFSLPSGKKGIMSDEVQHYYMQRATGGMGLMICQSLSVTSEKALDGAAGVYSDDHIN